MNNELNLSHIKQVIDICLLTATEPLAVEQIALAFDNQLDTQLIEKIVFNLIPEYFAHGLELLRLSNGFRLRSRIEYQSYLNKVYQVKPPKYSKAVMEIITIVAYKQPITRGEIEDIRGVTTNSNVIQSLFERQWIEIVGNKEVPGRPELLATTNNFLEDLGIASLQELLPLPNINMHSLGIEGNLLEKPGQNKEQNE